MQNFLSFLPFIVVAILILLAMITIHELGHYIAGRIFNFKINEFSVGFGNVIGIPKFWDKQAMSNIRERRLRIAAQRREPVKPGEPIPPAYTADEVASINNDYLFRLQWVNKRKEKISVRWFPLGGFCAFLGEDEAYEGENSFNTHKPWERLIVFFSGAFFNILSAVFFSMIYIAVIGFYCPVIGSVGDISPNTGLQQGDIVRAVDNKNVSAVNGFYELVGTISDGSTYTFTVDRNGELVDVQVWAGMYIEGTEDSPEPKLGFGIAFSEWKNFKPGFFATIGQSIPFTFKLAGLILESFGQILTGKVAVTEMGGPITTVRVMGELTQTDFMTIFILLPLIAVNLGVFNLFPIPALDGAKMVFVIIEWIRKKPINRNVEAIIHFCGLVALFGCVLLLDFINMIS